MLHRRLPGPALLATLMLAAGAAPALAARPASPPPRATVDAPAASPARTARMRQLQEMYRSYLTENGYNVSLSQDGVVQFEDVDFKYYINIDPDDPDVFTLVVPGIWEIRDGEQARVDAAVADVNQGLRGVKLIVVDKRVWAVLEMFLARPEDFRGIFERSHHAIASAAYRFAQDMR